MGIIDRIRGWFTVLFGRAKEEFNIVPVVSAETEKLVNHCIRAYQGFPDWADDDNHIRTVNFAKSICSETARLTTLGIKISLEGSARAEWLQSQVDRIYYRLRQWVEYGCACGTVLLKPNGDDVEVYLPGRYIITDTANGEITGAVFIDEAAEEQNKRYYTRMEYHRFQDGQYVITNRCYVGSSKGSTDKEIAIEATPWVGLAEEAVIDNLEKPLFAVLRMPHANNKEMDSVVSLPVFADALAELRDLDVAYSRNASEIYDSKRTVLLDADRLLPYGSPNALDRNTLPDYIRLVDGDGNVDSDVYHEINPTLNTDTRLTGINALLSQIGYKIGFSNGYFVFNESTGIQTATGVEAEQQRTVQFIKDCRDQLENCMTGLLYALNAFADLYDLAPVGDYEAVYDFGDITYNREEDRARCYSWVVAGKFPFWMYLVKYEGYTEDEAKAIAEEAKPKQPTLFGGEE